MQKTNSRIVLRAEKIRNIQQKDLQRLAGYSQEQLCKPAPNGGWSLIQVLNHLYLTQKGTINFLEKQIADKNLLAEKITLRNRFNALFLARALKSNKKFKAPSRLPEPLNDTDFGELKEKFEAMMANTMQIAEDFPKELENKKIFKHPRAGWLNIFDVLNFIHDHWYHHEYQMASLEKELK